MPRRATYRQRLLISQNFPNTFSIHVVGATVSDDSYKKPVKMGPDLTRININMPGSSLMYPEMYTYTFIDSVLLILIALCYKILE